MNLCGIDRIGRTGRAEQQARPTRDGTKELSGGMLHACVGLPKVPRRNRLGDSASRRTGRRHGQALAATFHRFGTVLARGLDHATSPTRDGTEALSGGMLHACVGMPMGGSV